VLHSENRANRRSQVRQTPISEGLRRVVYGTSRVIRGKLLPWDVRRSRQPASLTALGTTRPAGGGRPACRRQVCCPSRPADPGDDDGRARAAGAGRLPHSLVAAAPFWGSGLRRQMPACRFRFLGHSPEHALVQGGSHMVKCRCAARAGPGMKNGYEEYARLWPPPG
jgi:hypothetical protein